MTQTVPARVDLGAPTAAPASAATVPASDATVPVSAATVPVSRASAPVPEAPAGYASPAHVEYVLRLADSPLVLGQRLSEWCGHGPVLEEDIALANVALDLIGQARMLLTHAAGLRARAALQDEDTLAFLRTESEFRNLTLVELPNGDFGRTVLRNFLFAAFQVELWPALSGSLDRELAAIAAKAVKESRYHLRHAADWTVRLGDGSAESKRRMQRALDELWPYTRELFTPSPVDDEVARIGLGASWPSLQEGWRQRVQPVLAKATLAEPAATSFASHGKFGRHSEHLGRLLAEMQVLQRTYPGCRW